MTRVYNSDLSHLTNVSYALHVTRYNTFIILIVSCADFIFFSVCKLFYINVYNWQKYI